MKERLWTRHFILVCLVVILTNISLQMLNSGLSSFANDTWGSKSMGGFLTTVFNAGSIAMAFFSGWLAERNGRRKILIIGCLLFGIPIFLCTVWPVPVVALLVRFAQGIGKGMVAVASASIVSDIVAKKRMGEGMGFFGMGNALGIAFGPALFLGVTTSNYAPMFVISGTLYCLAAFVGLGINYEKKKDDYNKKEKQQKCDNTKGIQKYRLWRLIEKQAILPSVSYAVYFFSYACILVFVTVYSQEILKLTPTQISIFYIAAAGAMLLARLFGGKYSDQYGALTTLLPGHCSTILMLLLLAFVAKESYNTYLICGALYGLGLGLVMPTFNAIAIVDSPNNRGSAANATFFFMMDFGILFSSAIFGRVIDIAPTTAIGYTSTYVISAAVCSASAVSVLLLYNNKARNKRRVKNGMDAIAFGKDN